MKNKNLILVMVVLMVMTFISFSCKKEIVSPYVRVLAFDGNSIPSGWALPVPYPSIIGDSLGCTVYNCAIGGQTTLQMLSNSSDVDSLRYSILIVDEISNDLWWGASVDTAYARIVRYCRIRNAIIIYPTPRSNAGTTADFEQKRQELRIRMIKDFQKIDTLVYRNSFYAKGMIDLASDSLIGYQGAQFNNIYYQDLVHHTILGNKYRASRIIYGLKKLGF